MRPSRSSLPLLVLAALGVVLGIVLLWGGGGDDAADEDSALVPTDQMIRAEKARGERSVDILVPPPVVGREQTGAAWTSVLWPVRIELDLLQADYLPREKGVSPVGSGATAKLLGRVTDRNDRGARAEIHFVAGTNIGRVLYTDVTGRFGAADLYPGISIVEVRGKGLLGSRREVRLRQRVQTQLNIGYGRPGSINGRVQNTKGEGIEGASVVVDGTRVITGSDGGFYLGSVAAGQVLLEVECLGYSAYKEHVPIMGGKTLPVDQATYTLHKAASLTISVPDRVGGPGPVHVVILPAQLERTTDINHVRRNVGYPWHLLNPIEVWPDRPETVHGLPGKVVRLYAFRAGALAPQKVITLREGRPSSVKIPLTAAPKIVGRVFRDDKPVAGARVRVEAPDRVRATLGFFREQSYFLESAVMPELPAAVQEVKTDAEGRFTLTAWSEVSKVRFLEAIGPGNQSWAGRLVHPGDEVIDLVLEPVELADSSLILEFPGRWQGLPVEILIDGQPFDPLVVPAHENLPIGDLRAGKWRIGVTWNGDPLYAEDSFVIQGTTARELELPPEAVDGQNEEQWKRAGRVYPARN